MSYPQIVEYNEAVQHPQTAFNDPLLKQGSLELTNLGLPFARSGGFALTYSLSTKQKRFAVRCFHRQVPSAEQKYDAISKTLKTLNSGYFVDFSYQPKGIRVKGKEFPIVCMDWVDGPTLGLYLEANYRNANLIKALRSKFQQLSAYLSLHGIAHGDIQNGNLIISGEAIKLIDYDGIYVSGLQVGNGSETGHKHFQHPDREPKHFGPLIDRFSFIAVDLSLQALLVDPSLYQKFNEGGETIIFRANDFLDPKGSEVFKLLYGKQELKQAAEFFSAICLSDINSTPTLSDYLSGKNIPKPPVSAKPAQPKVKVEVPPISRQYVGAYEVADAKNYNGTLKFVGDRVELVGQIVEVKKSRSRRGAPYIFINFGPWQGNIVKLTLWSEGLSTFKKEPSAAWAGRWVSVIGLVEAPYVSRRYRYSHLSITVTHESQINFIDEKEALFRLASIGKVAPKRNSGILNAVLGRTPSGQVAASPAGQGGSNQAILASIQRAGHGGTTPTPTGHHGIGSPRATTASSAPSSNGVLSQIPWWAWLIGIWILITLFSDNKKTPNKSPSPVSTVTQPSNTDFSKPRIENSPTIKSDGMSRNESKSIQGKIPNQPSKTNVNPGASKSPEVIKPGSEELLQGNSTSESQVNAQESSPRAQPSEDVGARTNRVGDVELGMMRQACSSARYSGEAQYQICMERQRAAFEKAPAFPNLSSFSDWERQTMVAACNSSKYSGPTSYYSCMNNQSSALLRSSGIPDLSSFSDWERQTMATACNSSKYSGPASYYSCMNNQVVALQRGGKMPDLLSFSEWERQTMATACNSSKYSGPASYYSCINRQVAALNSVTAPNVSHLSDAQRQAVGNACRTAQYSGPASFYNCINRQMSGRGF